MLLRQLARHRVQLRLDERVKIVRTLGAQARENLGLHDLLLHALVGAETFARTHQQVQAAHVGNLAQNLLDQALAEKTRRASDEHVLAAEGVTNGRQRAARVAADDGQRSASGR